MDLEEVNELKESKMVNIFILIILFLVCHDIGILIVNFSGLPEDNPIEQAIELEIEEISGIEMDLTIDEEE